METIREAAEVYRFYPMRFYRVTETEQWLSEMAEKGLLLKELGRMLCTFERGAPRSVRYRLEPWGKTGPDEGFIEGCAEMGWDYAGSWRETFSVWRCSDPAAPEFHTDPAVQAAGFERLGRKLRGSVMTSVLAGLMVIAAVVFHLLQPVKRLIDSSIVWALPLWMLGLWAAVGELRDWLAIRRLIRQLKSGTLRAEQPKPRRLKGWSTAVFWALFVLVTAFDLAMPFVQTASSHTMQAEAAGVLPMPRLREIETGQVLEAEGLTVDGIDYANAVFCEWSPLAPEQITLAEQGALDENAYDAWKDAGSPADGIPITYRAEYTRLAFPSLAKRLLREEAEGLELQPVSGESEALWGQQDDLQLLLLRQDKQVLIVRYRGREDLRERIKLFRAALDTKRE